MKLIKSIGFSIAVFSVLFAAISPNAEASLRPVGNATSLAELQDVFTGIGSTIDAVNDQTTESLFEPTGAGNSVASYVATVSWGVGDMEFGIYDMDNPAQELSMFNYATATAADSVLITFDQGLDLVVVSNHADPLNPVVLDQSTYFREFGFYVRSDFSGITFYSDDDLNPNSFAHMLTYEGKGDSVTLGNAGTYLDVAHWYVAAEAWDITGSDDPNADFSDFVVQMESITPIPEPASIGLLGLISGGIYFGRRFFRA